MFRREADRGMFLSCFCLFFFLFFFFFFFTLTSFSYLAPGSVGVEGHALTDLLEVRLWQDPVAGGEEARVDARHLGSELGVVRGHVVRKHVRLGVIVVEVFELAVAALGRVAQRRDEEAVVVERVGNGRSRVGDVLPLPVLDVVCVPPACDTQFLGLGSAVRAKEGLPVVGYAEDDVGARECRLQGLHVVQVGLHHLGAERCQFPGRRRRRVAGQAAHGVPRVLEEATRNRTALVARRAQHHHELLVAVVIRGRRHVLTTKDRKIVHSLTA